MRITFDDGNWWEIKDWLTRRDRLAIREASQNSAIMLMERFTKMGIDMDAMQRTQQQMPSGAQKKLEVEAMPEEENTMLLAATVSWSWNEPVSEDAILDRSEEHTEKVLEAMRHRYEKRNGNNDEGKGKGYIAKCCSAVSNKLGCSVSAAKARYHMLKVRPVKVVVCVWVLL